MWLDTLAEALVNMAGHGFDPEGCLLPSFKPKQENRAKLPETPKKVRDIVDDGLMTDEDWLTPNQWNGWSPMTPSQLRKYKAEITVSRAVEIDFDEMPADMHGITEREYGEMKAYNPPLGDLKLASEVKRMKPTKTLKEIAQILGQTEQMVRHYSSALGKASPSPRRK